MPLPYKLDTMYEFLIYLVDPQMKSSFKDIVHCFIDFLPKIIINLQRCLIKSRWLFWISIFIPKLLFFKDFTTGMRMNLHEITHTWKWKWHKLRVIILISIFIKNLSNQKLVIFLKMKYKHSGASFLMIFLRCL